jgi:hypothetical protein
MTGAGPKRVHLTGAINGAYVVAEERADGSLVLKPDERPGADRRPPHRSDEQSGLMQLIFRPRHDPTLTLDEALESWGVALFDDEAVVEFVTASVDGEDGFVALTNRRLMILRGRGKLDVSDQHDLSEIASVEPASRGRRAELVINWRGTPPTRISGRREHLDRLQAGLAAPAGNGEPGPRPPT